MITANIIQHLKVFSSVASLTHTSMEFPNWAEDDAVLFADTHFKLIVDLSDSVTPYLF